MSLKLKDIIGPIVAAVAVIAGILQYRSTSQSEFIKPVREAQLKLYEEASSAAAQIAILKRDTPEWTKSHQSFLTLYYGPLAMVEDFDHDQTKIEAKANNDLNHRNSKLTVERAMILFKSCMDDEKRCTDLGTNLNELSLALAHTCRASLGRSWGYDLKQLEGDYQKIALDYQTKLYENEGKTHIQR